MWREFKIGCFRAPNLILRGYILTTKIMTKYCISVDWFEFCCYGNLINVGKYVIDGREYQVVDSHQHTRTFENLYYLLYHGLKYATIKQKPRSSALKQGLTLIQISNRVLYSQQYVKLAYSLLDFFHLSFKGISRLDLCYDCNTFYGGRSPSKFVTNFVLKDPLQKGGIVRRGSDKFDAHGSRSFSHGSRISSIRFGSIHNDVTAYMYDKSIELREVKDKPWIRAMWEENGLVDNEDTHVWRSEISIKAGGKDLVNLNTGELFSLSPSYLEHYEDLVKLFHFYAAKYFDFRLNDGSARKRDFKPIKLFDDKIEVTCKPTRISNGCDSGRSEKVCRNTLVRIAETYVDLTESVKHRFYQVIEFLDNLAALKSRNYHATAYQHYLSTIKAHKFFNAIDFAYLETIERAREERKSIDAEAFYQRYSDVLALDRVNDKTHSLI